MRTYNSNIQLIEYSDFINKYLPVRSPDHSLIFKNNRDAMCNIYDLDRNNVFSLISFSGEYFITPGYQLESAVGYFITRKRVAYNEFIELSRIDILKELNRK